MLCIILLTFLYRVQLPISSEYCIRTGFLLLYVCVLTELAAKGAGAGWQWHLNYLHFFPHSPTHEVFLLGRRGKAIRFDLRFDSREHQSSSSHALIETKVER